MESAGEGGECWLELPGSLTDPPYDCWDRVCVCVCVYVCVRACA